MDTSGSIITSQIDKSQIPPLHQKRILAFVNHFLINSCSFLNDFAEQCEYKFIEVERKLQKVEAALTIIEAKLSSVPSMEPIVEADSSQSSLDQNADSSRTSNVAGEPSSLQTEQSPTGIAACEDIRYKKFFKMLQVGVPTPAVKLKMKAEGLDESILDTPNAILPDGMQAES